MISDIVRHTPTWVWALLFALVAYGIRQTRTRIVATSRLVILPIAMVLLSASGTVSAFGASPLAVGGWLVGAVAAFAFGRRLVAIVGAEPAGSAEERAALRIPGSPVPLVLILAIFATKYVVGATLALHPAAAADPAFSVPFALVYGVFAGLFLTRAASLGRLLRAGGALRAC